MILFIKRVFFSVYNKIYRNWYYKQSGMLTLDKNQPMVYHISIRERGIYDGEVENISIK